MLVYHSPAGTVGVMICADSWFPNAFKKMDRKGVKIIAPPSYIAENRGLTKRWNGYSGWANLDDVADEDLKELQEEGVIVENSLPGLLG